MSSKKLYLVSASPRRKELMQKLDLNFSVKPETSFKENIPDGMALEDVPAYFAEGKAKGFHRHLEKDEVLVAADTVVICDGELMGKPRHRKNAAEMLAKLSGKTHKVVTAVCVRDCKNIKVLTDTAFVTFRRLTNKEIEYYVETYTPVDKAGGYGIQDWIGLSAITRIEGSFYTIMGLPTHLLVELLHEFE